MTETGEGGEGGKEVDARGGGPKNKTKEINKRKISCGKQLEGISYMLTQNTFMVR